MSDLSYKDEGVIVIYHQRRLKCKNSYCDQGHFLEQFSFVDGKRTSSMYVIDEIMKNKEKTVRTISAIMSGTHKLKISRSIVSRIIQTHAEGTI